MTKLYGKGSITEVERGKKYRIALSAGRNPITGKYERVQETFLGTRRQAELRVEEIRRELMSGKRADADKVSFSEWMDTYLEMREGLGKLRKATLRRDRTSSNHLRARLGDVKLADITPAVINALWVQMRKDGVGDTTIVSCYGLLKRVMAYALDNDLILRNPVDRAERPKQPKPKRNALSVEDARRLATITSSGTPTANKVAVFLLLSLGARRGEVLGLTWGHVHVGIDVERPYVYIVQQLTPDNERTALKTDRDESPVGRFVPLDSSTVALLMAWRSEQRDQLNALGIEQGTDTPVITNNVGGWSSPDNFERWWRSFSVENGFGRWVDADGKPIVELTLGNDATAHKGCTIIWRDEERWPCDETGRRYSRTYKRPKVRRRYDGPCIHELRHSHFTMRLADGMDIPTAQALGGWSTPAVLMNVYAHPVPENVWNSVGFMDRLTV